MYLYLYLYPYRYLSIYTYIYVYIYVDVHIYIYIYISNSINRVGDPKGTPSKTSYLACLCRSSYLRFKSLWIATCSGFRRGRFAVVLVAVHTDDLAFDSVSSACCSLVLLFLLEGSGSELDRILARLMPLDSSFRFNSSTFLLLLSMPCI